MTTPMTSETSWIVSRGSLNSVVTFESFDFPIDSESTTRKPPLLLLPPSSSDFEPCEIKLNFTQMHEIRQVYVRSTARIYEIYYAPGLQSDNEYLCTVRCSAGSVEGSSLAATDVKEAISVESDGPICALPKARVVGETKIGSNEDDWVEVKLPVGPDQTLNNSQNYQDFYEATAEINDAELCMSLTVRLLSLQSKNCVYVDEVYVFAVADPSDSNDTEIQTVDAKTSTDSSLVTMLVPTLLGLTKSRSVQLHDQNNSIPVGKLIKTESEPTTSTNHVYQQDETCQKPSEARTELTRSHFPALTPDKDKACVRTTRNEFLNNRAEILMEQLVTRVSRVEDICMRFEENMLKPLNSIEARLQRVEQQVELLGRCPVPSSFSRLEQNPRLLISEVTDSRICDEPELEKTVSFSTGTHLPPEDTSMATVQEFPFYDEIVDVLESPNEEKPKKTVSIDDALAAALAGFSSFTKPVDDSTVEFHVKECLKHNQASIEEDDLVSCKSLKEAVPEFIGEEHDDVTSSCDVYTEIPNNSFHSHGVSELDDVEAMGPTTHPICPSSPPNETEASINTVRILTFDKTDILRHYSDQFPDMCASRIDFDSPILEVRFASFEDGSHKSSLEALLPYSDDAVIRTPDDRLLIEEQSETTNNLLVDLGGDDICQEVQLDLPHVELETCFASLI
ncbi:hypothetical protein E3N88_32252 [Mikania micrantha]|uniref:Uncharacterized protein n=1 Tax=Mikania micrantha TaxID=192012 RepID=A0A5N6M8N3_9ASTR|nr:hypothetical protein E3N88_32252 [Mikania micrantha]